MSVLYLTNTQSCFFYNASPAVDMSLRYTKIYYSKSEPILSFFVFIYDVYKMREHIPILWYRIWLNPTNRASQSYVIFFPHFFYLSQNLHVTVPVSIYIFYRILLTPFDAITLKTINPLFSIMPILLYISIFKTNYNMVRAYLYNCIL